MHRCIDHFFSPFKKESHIWHSIKARFSQKTKIVIQLLFEEKVSLEELLGRLGEKVREAEEKTVVIKADEEIDLGLAVRVMDIARQAEAENVVISTKVEEDVRRQSN